MINAAMRSAGFGLVSLWLLAWPGVAPALGGDLPPLLEIVAEPGDQDDVATAFNRFGLRFLVVWNDDFERIQGRFVAPRPPLARGQVRLGDIFTIGTSANQDAEQPSLAVSKKGRFLVVWRDDSAPMAALLDWKGGTIRSQFPVDPDNDCGSIVGVSVAYNSRDDEWLVVCASSRGLKGLLLDADANPLPGGFFEILPRPSGALGRFVTANAAYDSKSREYLVTGLDQGSFASTAVVGRRVSADGDPIGDRMLIGVDDATGTNNTDDSLTYDRLRHRFLVVWRHSQTGSLSRIEARFIAGGSGDLGDRFFITDGTENALSPAVVVRGARYLIIWMHSGQGIYGQSLRLNGGFIGGNFVVADDQGLTQTLSFTPHELDCAGSLCLMLWFQAPDGGGTGDIGGRLLFRQR